MISQLHESVFLLYYYSSIVTATDDMFHEPIETFTS